MNVLRRMSLSRLLLLCGATVAIGVSATALALALGGGPTPPEKPLAQAVHDALAGGHANPVQGYSATIKLTNHLVEGSELAGGGDGAPGGLASSPLLKGASGRMWVSADGRMRLELQAEQGDTQIVYDGHTVTAYDASSNTIYRYTPKQGGEEHGWSSYAPFARRNNTSRAIEIIRARIKAMGVDPAKGHGTIIVPPPVLQEMKKQASGHAGRLGVASPEIDASGPNEPAEPVPSVAKIEEALSEARKHANVSEGSATDVGGRPAYTVRVSPKEAGSLIGGAELSFDADNALPLRAAVYSSKSSSPVIELAASEVSYGPVDPSVFKITPPADAKIEELKFAPPSGKGTKHSGNSSKPKLTTHGKGISSIEVLEAKSSGSSASSGLESLPKVKIGATTASELRTELGTILTFERGGLRYVLAGAVEPAAVEALAKGL